ncbi:Cacna1s [Symbiodinium natans]|uniref:Cacna1s protein n=1 Tax=Symbiodinium natans TaxID=878477 RepID=A0A812U1G7_9DINO|nr:Cacna1s [Symbiodinium natans]
MDLDKMQTYHGDSETLLGSGISQLSLEQAQKIRNRLRLHLGAISGSTLVSGKSLLAALAALGLTTYDEEDMNDLVNHLADFIGLWFEPFRPSSSIDSTTWRGQGQGQEESRHGRPRWRWPDPDHSSEGPRRSITATVSHNEPLRRHNVVPAQALTEVFLSKEDEMIKKIFGTRLMKQFKAMQEILLAGDTNRLVAELTFVRINDLAAPPEPMHPLMYIEMIVAILIIANGVLIGFQTDPKYQDWEGFSSLELFIQCCLFVEICARMTLLGCRQYWCGSEIYWNGFDLFLFATGLIDLTLEFAGGQEESDLVATSLLRFCRLIRLVRIVKVFRIKVMQELRLMVKGLVAGIRTLALAFVLLFVVLYVISGFASMTIGNHEETARLELTPYFYNIPESMFTAFRCFTGECVDDYGKPIHSRLAKAFGLPFIAAYVVSYMLVAMGIFNVILAVYVEITMKAAKESDAHTAEQYSRESIRIARITRELLKKFETAYRLFNDMDNDSMGSGTRLDLGKTTMFTETEMDKIAITKELFLLIIQDSGVQKLMNDLDLPRDRANLFEIIDADASGTLQITELLQGLLKMRGEINKSDAVASLLVSRSVQSMLSEAMAQNQKNLLELWAEFQKELLSMRMALAPYQKATATKPMSRQESPMSSDPPLAPAAPAGPARQARRKTTVTFDSTQVAQESSHESIKEEAAEESQVGHLVLQLTVPCKPSVCEDDVAVPSWPELSKPAAE